ncbi:hypothetical protein LAZ29_00800 [Cereibacter sphaeroides]|uniref:M10 family metallopeptidase C-terminal domain-containing protein n=1 Tax=Cereibacter sphaeroides TaxID=1063 RepID=UPI001F30991F|nr:M10 family metallopeptidase C-terminal domain-containing protein [Cereibacter sphaeroides]MCE6949494.1 hypothetical protein [Cereibacter sphaeroides]
MSGTAYGIAIDGTPTDGENPYIDALCGGSQWTTDGNVLGQNCTATISFNAVVGEDPYGLLPGESSEWTESYIYCLNSAINAWESVANIDFVEAADLYDADVWYWMVDSYQIGDPAIAGWHEFPAPYNTGEPAYGVFNAEHWLSDTTVQGGFMATAFIHEIGHGLGLAHPHDGGSDPEGATFPGVTLGDAMDLGNDSMNQGIWTIMSYNDGWIYAPPSQDYRYGCELTPMALDIAAIQLMYGANYNFATGTDIYTLPEANGYAVGWACIWDAGGTDTISNAGCRLGATINLNDAPLIGLNAGGFASRVAGVSGGFTIAHGAIIENATGGIGHDTLVGNGAANTLNGGGGNDTLTGGAGNDTFVTDGGDTITEAAGGGTDLVQSSVSLTLGANLETLTLTGLRAINGTGNGLANRITGNGGANVLSGGTGADTLIGGLGNDTYVTDGGDTITEAAGGGRDLVQSSVSLTLGANLENLTLTGSGAIKGTGNGLANRITGNGAANVLNGGTGADTLVGGLGNDTFVTDGGDTITEAAGGGTDLVQSSVSLTLGANLETLTLTGSGAIKGTGNGLANRITGNGAANVLNGGTGADTLVGGLGNDTYVTDGGDTITEAAGAGTDLVQSSVSLTLGANLENLTLTGLRAINGTGNGLANRITGNGAANVLNGGTGADTLVGGLGNDTLTGGAGTDSFVFNTSLGAQNLDRIIDFSAVDDTILLENAVLAALSAGQLGASAFTSNTSGQATDALDRLIYEKDSGALWYDADGTGSGAHIKFATLSAGLSLTSADFLVI